MSRMTAPDWFRIITDLIYAGVSMREIGRNIDIELSEQVLRHYRSGTQPLYPRGEALIRFWCSTLNKQQHEIPRVPFVRGHRAQRKEVRA